MIDHDDGTLSIDIRANFKPEDLAGLEVTAADRDDYCELFRRGSERVWQLTNGQHYFESVAFSYGARETDVFLLRGERSWANGSRILLQFKSPHPSANEEKHVETLAHEWGHYFYHLADEYSEAKDLGWCSSGHYNKPSESCSGFPESSCADGSRCIRHDTCVNPGADISEAGLYDGYYILPGADRDAEQVTAWGVVSANQCAVAGGSGPHAVCVLYDPTGEHSHPYGGPRHWPNWGMSCIQHEQCDTQPELGDGLCTEILLGTPGGFSRHICEGESACAMARMAKPRWCDETHIHEDQDGVSLSHNLSVLSLSRQNPNMLAPEDYNCWDQAKSVRRSLQFDGTYRDDLGLPPNHDDPEFCSWHVPDYTDVEAIGDWSMIVIDASGSMGADANGVPGWTYAVDGATYFNQVAVERGTRAGVYGFGDQLWPLQWANVQNDVIIPPPPGVQQLELGQPTDLAAGGRTLWRSGVEHYIAEPHSTNLCTVLEGANASFTAAQAFADREVVLLTDANFNTWPDLPEAECRGIDAWIQTAPELATQICDEAGMRVNVITTGASPDMDLAQWLADACGGFHYYAGDTPHGSKVYAAPERRSV